MKTIATLTAWIVLTALVNPATADVIETYTDRAAFNASVGPTELEDFNSFETETPFHTDPLDVGPFSLSLTGTPNTDFNRNIIDIPPVAFGAFDVDGTNVANVLTEIGDSLLLTFDVPIFAFGADFGGINNDFSRTGIVVADDLLALPVTTDSEVTFFGFQSDISFAVIEFRALDTDSYGIDNVAFSSVPEPNGIAIITVLTIGGFVKRRRKK